MNFIWDKSVVQAKSELGATKRRYLSHVVCLDQNFMRNKNICGKKPKSWTYPMKRRFFWGPNANRLGPMNILKMAQTMLKCRMANWSFDHSEPKSKHGKSIRCLVFKIQDNLWKVNALLYSSNIIVVEISYLLKVILICSGARPTCMSL